MVGLVAVKVELDVQGLPAPPLPGDAPEHAGVPAKVDAEVKAELLQVKVETESEVPGERHLAMKRAAVKAELRAGGLPTRGSAEEHTARLAEHGHGWTEPVKAGHLVQREQVVHGAAAGRGVPAAEMNAEVESEQQVKVETKTKVKSETKPPGQRVANRAPVPPPEGGATAPAAKRRRAGGAAPLSGAFCRRSRPRVPLPPVSDAGCDVSKKNSADASRWGVQFTRLAAYKAAHGDCNVPGSWPSICGSSNG